MAVQAGGGFGDVTAFNVFKDIASNKIVHVDVGVSAYSNQAFTVAGNTGNNRNRIDINSPVAQDVYFNAAVGYLV